MNEILLPVVLIASLGLIFGIVLSVASKVMAVKTDPRIEEVREVLPGANCGACGFAGCDDYAKAIVEEGVEPNRCIPGGADTAKAVGAIMGVSAEAAEKRVAMVRCKGTKEGPSDCSEAAAHPQAAVTRDKMQYEGIQSCAANVMFFSGRSACNYGCMGFGDCALACAYGALSIINGVAVVDEEKCVGCGLCAKSCPKHLIDLVPAKAAVRVVCSNKDKGNITRAVCSAGCIGCKKCERTCWHDAIHVENNCASIDYEKCTGCGECAANCPVNCIVVREKG